MTSDTATVDPLDVIEDLATRRRTNLQVDPGRPVPDALLERLIAIAATAPNHKRTFPWRFRIVTGDGRARLGAALAEDLEAGGEPEYKAVKAKGKYLRAPVVLAVASRASDNEELTKENRDATSAAIQNLLLAATAAGLASYWSTGAAMHSDGLRSVCEMDETDKMVGLIYIGWPVGEAPPIDRPAPEVLRIS